MMVRLYEYQSKNLLKEVGISVPCGNVASTPEEVNKITVKIGRPVLIKAQIFSTGRLKAGGIKFANDPEEAEEVARELFGSEIKGEKVKKVLVEEKIIIDKEYYVSVIIDDSYKVRSPVVMFSTEGGVDIEIVSSRFPDRVSRMVVPILRGFRSYDAHNLLLNLGVHSQLLRPIGAAICGLYEVFRGYDARVAEINPLVLTRDGSIVAVDCRITLDDSSLMRHPELKVDIPREIGRPPTELERIAWSIEQGDYRGISFFTQLISEIKEESYVGYHGIGGGGAILGIDALNRHGLNAADYAETSGNPPASKVYRLAKVILSQPRIEGYFLSGFAFANQEQWHHAFGLVKAMREELKDKEGFPVVIVIAGNKEKESIDILREGLEDLPINLEIYGREHVYDTDFIASRLSFLVGEYRKKQMGVE